MASARSHMIRGLHRYLQYRESALISRAPGSYCNPRGEGLLSYSFESQSLYGARSYPKQYFLAHHLRSVSTRYHNQIGVLHRGDASGMVLHSSTEDFLRRYIGDVRMMSTTKAVPAGARQVALKVTLLSPGFIYEPYAPREPISFWRRWFTLSGWRRTKEDMILEMKSAYAITRLRKKTGYTKKLFYQQAVGMYKEINTLMAKGDTKSLRKVVTEKMYSTLKNELKRRQAMWSSVYWELIEPVVSIRTMRARMIALDKDDLDKSFIQLTLEFVSKQKFEAHDSRGAIVAGDKTKEVLVRDIWVFERSLFHPGADWRLCGRIS